MYRKNVKISRKGREKLIILKNKQNKKWHKNSESKCKKLYLEQLPKSRSSDTFTVFHPFVSSRKAWNSRRLCVLAADGRGWIPDLTSVFSRLDPLCLFAHTVDLWHRSFSSGSSEAVLNLLPNPAGLQATAVWPLRSQRTGPLTRPTADSRAWYINKFWILQLNTFL